MYTRMDAAPSIFARMAALLSHKVRLAIAFILSLILAFLSIELSGYLALLIPFLFAGLMMNELFIKPGYENQLQKTYDSVSRYVYCQNANNIAEYHLYMKEGRIRTILGRIMDNANALKQQVECLNTSSKHAKSNVESSA